MKAQIVDIFSSIQGEGIFLGAKQIFVRFKACNMRCGFCDEPKRAQAKEYSSLELMSEIKYLDLAEGPHHSVALTGGEPLLYTEFLKIFLKQLKKKEFKTYLETNGTLPGKLAEVIEFIDIIAMDFKLPSSTGERGFWAEHLEFLKIARAKKVFVKAVITQSTTKEDIAKAASIIRKVKESVPLILQPATPANARDKGVDKNKLLGFLEIAARNHAENIRIIPQIHKMLDMK